MANPSWIVRKTEAQWRSQNPILLQGVLGMELDTGLIKAGDGAMDWAGLPYLAAPIDPALGPVARTEQHIAEIWETVNPVLSDQVVGYETDTRRVKIGDGRRPWKLLPYLNSSDTQGRLRLTDGDFLLLTDGSYLLLAPARG